jgi:hypothetical protein
MQWGFHYTAKNYHGPANTVNRRRRLTQGSFMKRTSGLGGVCILTLVAVAMLVQPVCADGQGVSVRYREGSLRGFLVLRSQTGAILASGEFTQIPRGDRIKLRLVFYFRDGSLSDETTLYSQKSTFRLISDRLVQRGPSFPNACEMRIDAGSQQVSMRALSKGDEAAKTEHMDLPPDLSNGLLFNMIKNLQPNSPRIKVSYLAAESKPRMVTLAIALEKEGQFTIAGRPVKAVEWDVKPELGGITGIVAPLVGKQPPDTHVWVTEGDVPTIVRVDGALYIGGPVWSIQLASPVW